MYYEPRCFRMVFWFHSNTDNKPKCCEFGTFIDRTSTKQRNPHHQPYFFLFSLTTDRGTQSTNTQSEDENSPANGKQVVLKQFKMKGMDGSDMKHLLREWGTLWLCQHPSVGSRTAFSSLIKCTFVRFLFLNIKKWPIVSFRLWDLSMDSRSTTSSTLCSKKWTAVSATLWSLLIIS